LLASREAVAVAAEAEKRIENEDLLPSIEA
jgi:hypothetical protein